MREQLTSTWVTFLVGIAMMTITMPAMASHNSVGTHLHLVEPDEFNADTGELVPDVAHDGEYALDFHHNLEEGLIAREAPLDQTGLHYDTENCDGPGEYEEGGQLDQDKYDNALREGDACYVGYFDQIVEYMFSTAPGLVTESPSDLLYWANPSADDPYCRGEEDADEEPVDDPVEQATNRAERQVTEGLVPVAESQVPGSSSDGPCDDSQDNVYLPGDILIDTSLAEVGFETAAETMGTDTASGSYFLGASSATYTFLFGQPHPDVGPGDIEEPPQDSDFVENARFVAGQGPFGDNPTEFGNPLHDLTGACGVDNRDDPEGEDTRRTAECQLLTPADILAYDPWTGDDDTPDPEQPRVCAYIPQLRFAVATDTDGSVDRDQGVCGNTGQQLDQFVPDVGVGGLALSATLGDEEAEDTPTWLSNLPGWSWGVLLTRAMAAQTTGYAGGLLSEDGSAHTGDTSPRPGFITYWAVNPDVPTRQGDLRCAIPNILTEGAGYTDDEGNVVLAESEDEGVYGVYNASAIDADIYINPFRDVIETAYDAAHPTVRDILGPVQETFLDDEDMYQETTDPQHSEAQGNALAIAEGLPDDIEALIADTLGEDADPVLETLDRASVEENGSTPAHAQPAKEDDGSNQHWFEAKISAGLTCNEANELVFNDEDVLLGSGLKFQADVTQDTLTLKDPTLLDGVLPELESETDEGFWQTDAYSFSGDALAMIDFSQNDAFDECPGVNLNPGDDLCPWESLWDAYGNSCENRADVPCGALLNRWGYNTGETFTVEGGDEVESPGEAADAGVGLYFVLKVTGPVVTTTDASAVDDYQALGLTAPDAENCIVGTSNGFDAYLPNHIGVDENPEDEEERAQAILDELCAGYDDANRAFFPNAFNAQSGVQRGTFSSSLTWAKILPTPDASSAVVDAPDSLCVTGIWSVSDEVTLADDTKGDNNIKLDGGMVHEFSHWQSLETGTDTPGHSAECQ